MTYLLESDVERACDSLIEKHGGRVVRLSQGRATRQTEGIADREYFVLGYSIRYEVKKLDGKLSAAQADMLREIYNAGGVASCGGVDELAHLLVALRHSKEHGRSLAWLFVGLWAARGLRKEKKAAREKRLQASNY